MNDRAPDHNYLFVSDLHISQGYDAERRAYHPREDFFFDEAFSRWLQWADKNRVGCRPWELVFVGDVFDFLPVDRKFVREYHDERDKRDPTDPKQVTQYWQRQFASPPPDKRTERIQRILFEEDVLGGQIQLESSPDVVAAMGLEPISAPDWAVQIHRRYYPEAEREQVIVSPVEKPPSRASLKKRARKKAFERQYGFPTPEGGVDKLRAIYEGHPHFFHALAWFVGQGHRVVIMRGNHDLELYWPVVQECLREYIANEYHPVLGAPERPANPLPPGFKQRIDFRPGWFYYRRGLFYAEHGKQYESLNACTNPIHPVLPDEKWLDPPVGSLATTCIHTQLEDQYPEWENEGRLAFALLDLARRHPLKALSIVICQGPDFLRMARGLWLAYKKQDPTPTEKDFRTYAEIVGLKPDTVKGIYERTAKPLLLGGAKAWLMCTPPGYLLIAITLLVAAIAAILLYMIGIPALIDLIPVEANLRLLAKALLWLVVPPVVYALLQRFVSQLGTGPLMFDGAKQIHTQMKEVDSNLRFYILGHDHRTDVQILERRPDRRHIYYLNTGCWFPEFAEGTRRLQTLGQEVQLTFVRLVRQEGGVQAELLRWNDDAERAERPIILARKREEVK
jgi:UDP-2,3-diacylglucosamine pyrophosphatase LpxH